MDAIKPFSVHTNLMQQYEVFLGGGISTGLATLEFQTNPIITVPCTHTEIVGGFELIPGGKSPNTFVERCEFRALPLGTFIPGKGCYVTLTISQGTTPLAMQIWDGGLEPGGEIYRFRLVDANYRA